MLPYWLLFSLFAAGALQDSGRSRYTASTPVLVFAAAATAIFIGFRFETGGDWANYEYIFWTISYQDFVTALTSGDPAYNVLNWLAHQLGIGIWFVNLVCGTIFTWGLYRFAKDQPRPWLTFTIAVPYLIIVVAMGYTRQAVAIGLIMASLPSFRAGQLVKFGLFVIAAAAFHKSAVVVLPLVGLAREQNRFLTAGLTVFLVAILYWLFLSQSIDELSTTYGSTEVLESQGAGIRVGMNFVPAAIFLLFQRRFGLSDLERRIWRNMSLAACLTLVGLILFPALSTLIDRLSLYLIPLQLVVLSRLALVLPNRRTRGLEIVVIVIAYSAAIQYVWLNYAFHARLWIPYQLYPLGSDIGGIY